MNPAENVVTADVRNSIYMRFKANREYFRSEIAKNGRADDYRLNHLSPIMYIVSSNDKVNQFFPSFLDRRQVPERLVFNLFLYFARNTCQTLNLRLSAFSHVDDQESKKGFLRSLFEDEGIYERCHLVFRFADDLQPKDRSDTRVNTGLLYNFHLPATHRLELFKNTPFRDLTIENMLM